MPNAGMDSLRGLSAAWRKVKQIKDCGDIGAAFDGDGYDKDGWRDMKRNELAIHKCHADALDAALDQVEPETAEKLKAISVAMDALESDASHKDREKAWDALRHTFYPLPTPPEAP